MKHEEHIESARNHFRALTLITKGVIDERRRLIEACEALMEGSPYFNRGRPRYFTCVFCGAVDKDFDGDVHTENCPYGNIQKELEKIRG